ncbi:MAG TPA: alkaline phosphatase family protein [Gemmatimonadales bacterium]|nr:alkaline phosphatase family protein [Gemmatimonadales bacterium]
MVVIAVDQLRPDYLPRYARQFTGGFRRILDAAAFFDHARQDHAITETAPGHSTILSGRDPAHTGIVSNQRGVADSDAPILGSASAPGASPRKFRGTTLYDWMRAADPDTRVLSVSRKDRGAILLVGRARAPVYWWVDGRFTTSRYYADSLPGWVQAFNARHSAERFAGRAWTPLLPAGEYAEPDSAPYENGGHEVAFPHPFPDDPVETARAFQRYPWMDSLTLAFALEGVHALGLGARARPDLLTISLSTTDAVGHAFGPDSRELHDHLLRLDRWLGWFMEALAKSVPGGRTLVVLTADHGVQSFPERSPGLGRVSLDDLVASAQGALSHFWSASPALDFDSGLLSADTAALRSRGVKLDSLAAALAAQATRRTGVRRVYTPASLRSSPPHDPEAALWRRTIPPGHGWLLCASLRPGFVWSPPDQLIAEHGSTAPADLEVPIAFMGRGVRPAVIHRPIDTVDIAPTLAALLGLRPAEALDGVPLPEVLPLH